MAIDRRLTHARWVIEKYTRAKQIPMLRLTGQVGRLEIKGKATADQDPRQQEYVRQLDIAVAKLEVEIEELERMPRRGEVKAKTWKDAFILWLFAWSRGEKSLSKI